MENILESLNFLLVLVLGSCSSVILIPFFIIIFIPLLLIKFFVGKWAKIYRPDLVRFVDAQSTVLALDDMTGQPISTLISAIMVKGPLTLEDFREVVHKYIRGDKTYENKQLHFPELRQYYESYLGFLFWKEDKNFMIENHVNLYEHDYEYVDEKILLEITKTLEKKPYVEKRSPWEILLVKNCNFQSKEKNSSDEEWAIIYRLHHGLSDGYSLIKKIILASDLPTETFDIPHLDKRTWFSGIFTNILTLLYAPYELCSQLINVYDRNVWHLSEREITRDWHVVKSKKLSVDMVKNMKNHYKVTFTDVLNACISGGIRNFFLEKNPNLLPKKMYAVVGQPFPNHPWKMCNHWTYGFLELPVGIADQHCRLSKCHYKLKQLKNSLSPVLHFNLLRLLGSLPNFLVTRICRNFLATIVISNMAGPKTELTVCSGKAVMVDAVFWNGLTRGNLGIGVAILSCCQYIHFTLIVDKAILATEDDVADLANKIYEQAVQYNNF